MGYVINYTYNTGDSFRTENGCQDSFSYSWDTIELAQEALQRMKEHYEWQHSLHTTWSDDLPEPKWWRQKPGTKTLPYDWDFNVMGNDKEEFYLSGSTYLGYFDSLISAEIIEDNPKNKIVF